MKGWGCLCIVIIIIAGWIAIAEKTISFSEFMGGAIVLLVVAILLLKSD